MKLTGTFICGTEIDIPSNNWGEKEWRREFEIMKTIGIDTVVLIHSGFRNLATFPSKTLRRHISDIRFSDNDMIELFLVLSSEFDIEFYMGTYVGALWGYTPDNCKEVMENEFIINNELIEELWDRYGKSPAFAGWYNSFELNTEWQVCTDIVRKIGENCKKISGNKPVLLSPYYIPYEYYIKKNKPLPENVSCESDNMEHHVKQWDEILSKLEGAVDIIAFQDADNQNLEQFLSMNAKLIKKHNMKTWGNVETFSRRTSIKFPPIDWQTLKWKMDVMNKVGNYEKSISFELPHFMSPNAFWPSGKCLFNRYCEYFNISL
jgi:hypothetical protein